MRTLLAVALLAAAPLLATVAKADAKAAAPKGDLAKLQGSWTAAVGPDKDIKLLLTFKETGVTLAMTLDDGRNFESKGTIKLDETARPHKAIDWRGFATPNGEVVDENLSIYEFDGDDTLKVCAGGPGKPRPAEFKDGGAEPPHLIVLSRAKEKATATDAPAPQGDLARFQGKWTALVGPQKDIPLTFRIEGNAVTFSGARKDGQAFEFKGEIQLDETAKPHKTIDWIKFVRPNGESAPENLGIYTFEGDDAIKVCSGGPGNARPTEFQAGEGGPPNLVILKRAKD